MLIIGFFAKKSWDNAQALEDLKQHYNEQINVRNDHRYEIHDKHQKEVEDGDIHSDTDYRNKHRRSHTNDLKVEKLSP